ncbi:MAG: hypothetical protein WA188_14615 [Terriglobales bacterium]
MSQKWQAIAFVVVGFALFIMGFAAPVLIDAHHWYPWWRRKKDTK